MEKKGIALITVVIVVVILSILTATLTVSAARSITNAKLYNFAKEIKSVEDYLQQYIEDNDGKLPYQGEYEVELKNFTDLEKAEIFEGETIVDNKITLVKLDMYELGFSALSRGNGKDDTDMYAYSETTRRIYYVKGELIGEKRYYRLTDELLKVLGIDTSISVSEQMQDGIFINKYPSYYTNQGVGLQISIPVKGITNANVTSEISSIVISKEEKENFTVFSVNMTTPKYKDKYIVDISYLDENSQQQKWAYTVNNADITPPSLVYRSVEYEYNKLSGKSDVRIIGLNCTDDNSGVKYIKYFDGDVAEADIKTTLSTYGTTITEKNSQIKIKEDLFILYAEDNAGNYVYYKISNDSQETSTKPDSGQGLIPIKYNPDNTIEKTTTTDPEWFDYDEKKWPNAISQDESTMWVWIPRFAYKIDNPGTANASPIDVIILSGNTNQYVDEYGDLQNLPAGYIVHPAFTNESASEFKNGGYNKELSGFWVAKFEAGYAGFAGASSISPRSSSIPYESDYENVKNVYGNVSSGITALSNVYMKFPVALPGAIAYNNIAIGDAYALCLEMNNTSNPYGFTASMNTHLMKSSEWGAVTYFASSKYGNPSIVPNINVITNNSTQGVYTGYGIDGVAYNVNYANAASTTGNIYGIFDMAGGSQEFVASFIKNIQSEVVQYGKAMKLDEKIIHSTALKNIYEHKPDVGDGVLGDTAYENYNHASNITRLGEAIWETSDGTHSWYNSVMNFPFKRTPFMIRGGNGKVYSTSSLSQTIFSVDAASGAAERYTSFRPIISIL